MSTKYVQINMDKKLREKNQLSFSFFNFSEVNGLMFLPEAEFPSVDQKHQKTHNLYHLHAVAEILPASWTMNVDFHFFINS